MNTPGMRWLEQACQVGFAQRNERAQLYAFDMLAGGGEDQRQLPLSLRKINLARLLKRRILGVFIAEYEEGEIGRDLPARVQRCDVRDAGPSRRPARRRQFTQRSNRQTSSQPIVPRATPTPSDPIPRRL